jgi:hypothetical protein
VFCKEEMSRLFGGKQLASERDFVLEFWAPRLPAVCDVDSLLPPDEPLDAAAVFERCRAAAIDAMIPGYSRLPEGERDAVLQEDARRLVAGRAARHLSGPADVARVLGQALPDDAVVGYGSRFFEVRGQLRLDRSVMQVRTLVERDGLNVKPLQQQRGALDAPVPVAWPGAR